MPVDVPGFVGGEAALFRDSDNFISVCPACAGFGYIAAGIHDDTGLTYYITCPRCVGGAPRNALLRLDGKSPLQRSKELLLAHLSSEQRHEFNNAGCFHVFGGESETLYQIRSEHNFNVYARGVDYCATLPNVPIYDQMLAQMLMLKFNERRFYETANIRAARNGMPIRREEWSGSPTFRTISIRHDDPDDPRTYGLPIVPTGGFVSTVAIALAVIGIVIGAFAYVLPAVGRILFGSTPVHQPADHEH